jgi:hypothetical protein
MMPATSRKLSGRQQRADHDRGYCGVAERKTNGGAKHQRNHRRREAERDRPVAGSAKQRKIDLQPGKEHQQQLAELRQKSAIGRSVPKKPRT